MPDGRSYPAPIRGKVAPIPTGCFNRLKTTLTGVALAMRS
jgi:hypothetical protein